MTSRVATRTNPTSSSSTTTRQPYPNNGQVHYAMPQHPPPRRAAAPPPVRYTVEQTRDKDGKTQEVLTLEDTPEPPPPSAAASTSSHYAYGNNTPAQLQLWGSTSSSRNDPYGGYAEPAPKKRKSDASTGSGAYGGAGGAASGSAYASTSGQQYQQQYNGGQQGYSNGRDAPYRYNDPSQTVAQPPRAKRKYYDDEPDASRSRDKGKEKAVSYADAEGHYIVKAGDTLKNSEGEEFRIQKLLGQGTFGKVVAAETIRAPSSAKVGKLVAIKIIRAVQKYQEAAKTEIRVLKALKTHDPEGKSGCIHLNQSFDFYGHTCLVTDLLSASVFDFLKENSYEPFPLSHVQQFARQLLKSLQYVHGRGLIHTDLKPENILLMDNRSVVVPSVKSRTRKLLRDTKICLIDFGSATFEKEYHATVVSTRHYRAPEIILCLGWSYPCDLWSIGCILVEFMTGEALFQTHENLEHLAMMEKVFGPMPSTMIAEGRKKTHADHPDWFKQSGQSRKATYKLNFPQTTTQKQSKKYVSSMASLDRIIGVDKSNDRALGLFHDLCKGLLTWEKSKRLTVDEALAHDFFKIKIVDVGTTYQPQ